MKRYGCLIAFGYFVIFMCVSLIIEDTLGGKILFKFIVILMGFGVGSIIREINIRQRNNPDNAKRNYKNDIREPIFYLREFKSDGTHPPIDAFKLLGPLVAPIGISNTNETSYEVNLVSFLNSVGPVVALSRPINANELGAYRVSSEDNQWIDEFFTLLHESKLIVLRIGFTENLIWEINEIIKLNIATKLILYIQIGEENEPLIQKVRYNKFRKMTENIFPRGLPNYDHKKRFIWFTDRWDAELDSAIKNIINLKEIKRENAGIQILKEIYPRCNFTLASNNWLTILSSKIPESLFLLALIPAVSLLLGGIYGAICISFIPLINLLFLLILTQMSGFFVATINEISSQKIDLYFLAIIVPMFFIYASWLVINKEVFGTISFSPLVISEGINKIVSAVQSSNEISNEEPDEYVVFRYIGEAILVFFSFNLSFYAYSKSEYEKYILSIVYGNTETDDNSIMSNN